MPFKIKRVSSVMGARVTGLDLSQPISDTAENELRAAFLKYHLLCFESRPLSVEKFLVFAKVFGSPQLSKPWLMRVVVVVRTTLLAFTTILTVADEG